MKLEDLGISPQLLLAGFGGGLVNAFALKQANPLAVCSSVVSGAIVANYLTPVIDKVPWFGEKIGAGACAFICGLCAMALVRAIADAVQVQISRFLKPQNTEKQQGEGP